MKGFFLISALLSVLLSAPCARAMEAKDADLAEAIRLPLEGTEAACVAPAAASVAVCAVSPTDRSRYPDVRLGQWDDDDKKLVVSSPSLTVADDEFFRWLVAQPEWDGCNKVMFHHRRGASFACPAVRSVAVTLPEIECLELCDCEVTKIDAPQAIDVTVSYCDQLASLNLPRAIKVSVDNCRKFSTFEAPLATDVKVHCCDLLTSLNLPRATKVSVRDSLVTSLSAPQATDVTVCDCYQLALLKLPRVTKVRVENCRKITSLEAPLAADVTVFNCGQLASLNLPRSAKVSVKECSKFIALDAPQATDVTVCNCYQLVSLILAQASKVSVGHSPKFTTLDASQATDVTAFCCDRLTSLHLAQATCLRVFFCRNFINLDAPLLEIMETDEHNYSLFGTRRRQDAFFAKHPGCKIKGFLRFGSRGQDGREARTILCRIEQIPNEPRIRGGEGAGDVRRNPEKGFLDLSGLSICKIAPSVDGIKGFFEQVCSDPSFARLESIDLSNNPLSEVPADIAMLGKVRRIGLSGTALEAWPEVFNSMSLEYVNVDGTPLALRDDWAFVRQRIQEQTGIPVLLPVGRPSVLNDIELFKECLRKLDFSKDVEFLFDLSGRKISGLSGRSVEQMVDLSRKGTPVHMLRLIDNPISSLPGNIGMLSDLKVLDLTNTQITAWPEALTLMPHLSTVLLGDTPLVRSATWSRIREGIHIRREVMGLPELIIVDGDDDGAAGAAELRDGAVAESKSGGPV